MKGNLAHSQGDELSASRQIMLSLVIFHWKSGEKPG